MKHKAHAHTGDSQVAHKVSELHASHDRHAGHSVAMFRDKFWLSFALTIPVVFWSPDVQHWLGYTAPSFPGSKFIPAILGTVVFIYGGMVFVRGAWRSEEHTSELQSHSDIVCRLLLEKKKIVTYCYLNLT